MQNALLFGSFSRKIPFLPSLISRCHHLTNFTRHVAHSSTYHPLILSPPVFLVFFLLFIVCSSSAYRLLIRCSLGHSPPNPAEKAWRINSCCSRLMCRRVASVCKVSNSVQKYCFYLRCASKSTKKVKFCAFCG